MPIKKSPSFHVSGLVDRVCRGWLEGRDGGVSDEGYWQVLHPPCERQTVEVFSWASQGNEDILRFHLSEVLDEGVEMGDIPLEFVRMRQCQYAVRLVLASTCVAEVQGSLFCR